MHPKILEYDTIYFDLDFTIWKGNKPHFWAKLLSPPVYRKLNFIIDSNGDSLELEDGIVEVLKQLKEYNKRVGFITRGGVPDKDFENQPPVICLRLYHILFYFNYNNHVLLKDDKKSRVIIPNGRTLFIDDNQIDLDDVAQVSGVEVYDKKKFQSWKELL